MAGLLNPGATCTCDLTRGCRQYGAFYVGKSTTVVVAKNYFEASPRQVVSGEVGSGTLFAANSPIVRDNYFTTRTATPFNIELENTQ